MIATHRFDHDDCGENLFTWAPHHRERAEIKFHAALRAKNQQPLQAIEILGSRHDGPMSEVLAQTDYIWVMDHSYGKLERLTTTKSILDRHL